MALTLAQKQVLKADIIAAADQACQDLEASPNNSDLAFAVAALYNLPATETWIVWRTTVTRKEVLQNGFDWTRLDNLSVGKARVWSDIFVDGALDASKPNVRAGIESIWVGTAQDLAVRAAVYVHCKRQATRVEKVLSSGTGSDASPATMTHEGQITFQHILDAMQV